MEIIEIAFLIGFILAVLSSGFISFKVYKALKGRGNVYAAFLAIACGIASVMIMGFALFVAWMIFGGGFSRR